jgi:exonuclease SbcC
VKLISIEAENFRSFERLELDLRADGVTAVVGDNGAGKSTIFAAIEWALYGTKRGPSSTPVRRDDCPENAECFVEVEFEIGGRAYGVRRVDKKTARLFDATTDETICTQLDETSRQVATLLGLSREMFCATFYARQKEVLALDSDNERRVAQVEVLLGVERLRRAADYAQEALKEQRAVLRALDADVPDVDALRAEAEQVEREAQQGDLRVQAAKAKLKTATEAKTQAAEALETLRGRERTMIERRAKAQSARTSAEHEQRAAEALRAQVTEAEGAAQELKGLAPLAEQVEPLTARERELDHKRSNHERAEGLRSEQRAALERAAQLADQLAAVRGRLAELVPMPTLVGASVQDDGAFGDGDDRADGGEERRGDDAEAVAHDRGGQALSGSEQLARAIERRERKIEALREREQQLDGHLRALDTRLTGLREQLRRGAHAAELDAQLATQADAEQAVERALERWAQLGAQRTQLDEAIRHDTEHREAVLAGETQAACPTCKRTYEHGERDEIVAGYDADLAAARTRLAELDTELAQLKSNGAKLRTEAERLRGLAADRRALGDVADAAALDALREQLAGDEAQRETLDGELARVTAQRSELASGLPALRERARRAGVAEREAGELAAHQRQAEGEARLYAEQLAAVGVNGYQPDEHTRVRTQLAEATKAAQRCAVLRAKADGLKLLRRRLAEQEAKAQTAAKLLAELDAAVSGVAVSDQQLDAARSACARAEQQVEQAGRALIEASQKASTDSDAVAGARARLADAREQARKLRSARGELRLRGHVADALSALREDASRRARPTLEHETARLLGKITRGRYSAVQMSDSYALEIVAGRSLHPLKRFSGGEQDLAALCLRLALSRTLARTRGAETGFVLLDEVFASQDPTRRRALLAQLRALAEAEFRQVFVISHTDDVTEHSDLHIDVSREDDEPSVAVGPRR